MEISSGKKEGAQKVLVYGPEGFGKSTFASYSPDPVFIDTEGSTKHLDVKRLEADMSDWDNILEATQYVVDHPDCCKTLVIDTVDWAENACIHKLNERHKTANVLTLDYGKGSQYVVAEFERLLTKLDILIKKGINVFMTAHAAMRKQELPNEMGAFDRWELKLQSKQVKSMVKEWADLVLFGNYKTYVTEDSKTKSKKAQGNKRVMYATHHPCWDAKNRHGLPDEMPFEFSQIEHIFAKSVKNDAVTPKNAEKPSENAERSSKKEVVETKAPETEKPDEPVAEEKPERFTDDQKKNRRKVIEPLKIPDDLKALMMENYVADWDIQEAVGALKGSPYDATVKMEEYSPEFCKKLVKSFPGMLKKIQKNWDKADAELPFDN